MTSAPEGRQSLSPRWGLPAEIANANQGLTPLAIDGGRVAARKFARHINSFGYHARGPAGQMAGLRRAQDMAPPAPLRGLVWYAAPTDRGLKPTATNQRRIRG